MSLYRNPPRPLLSRRSRASWPSTTAAFFASPFAPVRSVPSPSQAAGFFFHSSIPEEPEPIPMERPFSFQDFRPTPSSSTPSSSLEGPDRLDSLLAELDAQSFAVPSKTEDQPLPKSTEHDDIASVSEEEEQNDWDSGLESISSSPVGRSRCDCLNCGFTDRSSSEGEGSSSGSSGSGGSEEESWSPLKVRFCEGVVEEVLTWSPDIYDRKGPEPITRLSMREVIELKLIKEEVLGLRPVA
ncbi:hypothetical protein CROQUDRAFT_658554 [Cronartium quercuum f. sp. fusiforme G11]|uniref:Uncharacterized protein n=1 Tax=Cronartium quercuum f. sp. fusiforme G11 TaxID=708437 RepID=A0A9P6NGE4_9BASI|nr:hypothetical protein CROQUDRAFT_658554 [Cronartium quercuum f. sp. fusiforme G11]